MTATAWHNRIVGSGEEQPDQLLANPRNFRIHPKHQQAALEGVLNEVGWVDDVIVNRTTGHIIDGHLRVTLALRRGETVPVKYVELTEAEEALILATFDPISALAVADKELLESLLNDVSTSDAAVMQMLADLAEQEGIVSFDQNDSLTDPDDVPEPPADPITKPGDLWILGRHRLLCGDSTNRADVDRLMNGEKAEMVFTDPPYGVDYVGKTKDALKIKNDALGDEGTRELVRDSLAIAPLKPGAAFYVCSPAGNTETAFRLAIADARLELRQCLVWVKQQFVMGRQDYHWRHESILYGWKDGAAHYFVDDRTQDTVWEVDRPMASKLHPTMKPIALIEKAINNSSQPGDTVLDLFGGSGSTLIACEQTNRVCRMMELDPIYCDVIVQRWEAFTGQAASREAVA